MDKSKWDTSTLQQIPCPKCGVVGQLVGYGLDNRKKFHRVFCNNCKRVSTENQLGTSKEAIYIPRNTNNNTDIASRIERIEQLLNKIIEKQRRPLYPLTKSDFAKFQRWLRNVQDSEAK